jgi:hypothetical protein
MLEGIAPSDPVLLLAIVDGNFEDLPTDVQTWFGHTLHNRLELSAPNPVCTLKAHIPTDP